MIDWSKFTLKNGQHILAAPCLEVVAFSYETSELSGPGFARFLQTFESHFGDRFTFYRTGDMKRFRPFVAGTLDAPYHWFSDEKILFKKMLRFEAHSGDIDKNIYPPAIDLALLGFYEPPRFVFQMMLPVEVADTPDEVVSLVQDALAEFPLENGFCGYSSIWNHTDLSLRQEVGAWAAPLMLRHPGLGYGNRFMFSNAADKGVAAVSWLTLLGSQITADLGGLEDLQSRCSPDVSILPLGNGGALLRAGFAPELGDVNRQELLPAYRAVGRLVAPRRTTDEALGNVLVSGMSEETAHEWLLRFFD